MYADQWYTCTVTDLVTTGDEPDWSKVPATKRDVVQAKWRQANMKENTSCWLLWGPQIPFLRQFSTIVVTHEVS